MDLKSNISVWFESIDEYEIREQLSFDLEISSLKWQRLLPIVMVYEENWIAKLLWCFLRHQYWHL
jgi:hypothetical protein